MKQIFFKKEAIEFILNRQKEIDAKIKDGIIISKKTCEINFYKLFDLYVKRKSLK